MEEEEEDDIYAPDEALEPLPKENANISYADGRDGAGNGEDEEEGEELEEESDSVRFNFRHESSYHSLIC